MGIEEALERCTAALNRNSDILEKGMGKVAASATTAKPATVAAAPKTTAAKPTTTKPAAGKKAPTEQDIRDSFGGYLAVKDKAEKDARKEQVRAILAHFGVTLASEIPAENRAEAIGYVKQLTDGETPSFMNEDASGDESEEEEDGESLV